MSLKGRTLFITGATRGIGKAIALRAAKDGANIVVTGKTSEPHPKLEGTIFQTAEEIAKLGGTALPVQMDIRDETQIESAVLKAKEVFGGIDILVNNASAISLTPSEITPMKRYDLMMDINVRGTFAASIACLPFLKESETPHILTLSPPLSLDPKWFAYHTAYTISKFGMSMCVLGMAEEFKKYNISVNALWPKTLIGTAALQLIGEGAPMEAARKPEIVADAAYTLFTMESPETGQFFIDEDVLTRQGKTDFATYSVVQGNKLMPDLFTKEFRYG